MSFGGALGSLSQLLGMIEGASAGTLPMILAQVEDAGLAERVRSWMGHGKSLPVTAAELHDVFTPEQLNAWAAHAGTTHDAVLKAMAAHLKDAAALSGPRSASLGDDQER